MSVSNGRLNASQLRQALVESEAENERLKSINVTLADTLRNAAAQLTERDKAIAAARDEVGFYSQHSELCALIGNYGDCNCWKSRALTALATPQNAAAITAIPREIS